MLFAFVVYGLEQTITKFEGEKHTSHPKFKHTISKPANDISTVAGESLSKRSSKRKEFSLRDMHARIKVP